MQVNLTESAYQEIAALHLPDGHGIRVDALISGGCGCTVHYELAIDEERKRDQVLLVREIPFFIDHFTQVYLEGDVTLDHVSPKKAGTVPSQAGQSPSPHGFKLFTSAEILGIGLQMKSVD